MLQATRRPTWGVGAGAGRASTCVPACSQQSSEQTWQQVPTRPRCGQSAPANTDEQAFTGRLGSCLTSGLRGR